MAQKLNIIALIKLSHTKLSRGAKMHIFRGNELRSAHNEQDTL